MNLLERVASIRILNKTAAKKASIDLIERLMSECVRLSDELGQVNPELEESGQ